MGEVDIVICCAPEFPHMSFLTWNIFFFLSCVCSGGLHKTVSPSLSPTETFKPTAFSVLAMTRTKGCSNEKNWRVGDGLVLYAGMTCDMIESSNTPKKYCDAISKSDDGAFMRKSVSEAW